MCASTGLRLRKLGLLPLNAVKTMTRFVCLLGLLSLAACSKSGGGAASFGDPSGIRVSAAPSSQGAGAGAGTELDVAIAATKGKDLSSAVNKLAVAFHGASKACPDLATLGADKTLQVRLAILAGKLKAPDNKPEDKLAACVVSALDGKEVTAPSENMDLLAEFRLHAPAGT